MASTKKSAQITVVIDRTSVWFIIIGLGLGYYFARKRLYSWTEE
jgi:hypothetical protein